MSATERISVSLDELVDREEIRDSLMRYARGIDRLDEELIRSAFHEDAIDYHGAGAVTGSPADFLAWWLPQQGSREATQHYLTNMQIEISGTTAHCETYYFCTIKQRGADEITLVGGRYVDRFELRDVGWRIALRVVIADWTLTADGSATSGLLQKTYGHRSPLDPSYSRPLTGPSVSELP
jgi:SnoaL-like domain